MPLPSPDQPVPTDRGLLLAILALTISAVVLWALSKWMEKYAEEKERELQEELEEMEREGKVY
jgi:membrane protein implicated in regulation of membrane protease activity